MRVLAIIPARGGSKGVPNKNIIPVLGKPLVHYTIESALESEKISKILLSSDSEKILKSCKKFNIEFNKREQKLSSDISPIIDTVFEILNKYDKEHVEFDAVLLLQPTSPIKTGVDIDNAISLLEKNKEINSVISVVEMDDTHPARMYWENEDATLKSILPEYEKTRRQEIPKALYRNGVLYLTRVSALRKEREIMVKPSLPYKMNPNYLVNIDEPRDLLIAEVLIKAWQENKL
ncbi:MAG TPA: acylneuraminate cytidylyltransferase [Flavobacteriaceae bacterium]|jgi:CMP-N-acetylneuraminic acid synthetase|nr:acylneuraminate cytidylyltransferase [Flavobacteriaceae bacterium]HBS11900.1 acylneuraminate cytidylyltransferase [Flavobacteriaceae bacterium]